MSLNWSGTVLERTACNLGPLAVVAPLLEQMDVAAIIDRHLPADPQREYSHGQVLRLLLGARLCQPLALVNVAQWAEDSGAEFLWDIPAAKLNDDRLGRALDALYTPRHSILASVAAHVISTFRLPKDRLHYDPTHLLFYGAYDGSQPIPDDRPRPPTTPSADYPPAHITHGYLVSDCKMIHAGLCSIVDDLGAVPIFGHTVSGNDNSRTAIAEQFQLLQDFLRPDPFLMISDRGTYSAGHVARLERAGHHVLCSVPWRDFQPLFEQHRDRLFWNRASYLSVEQQRRRQCASTLPREYHELAVLRHQITDPDSKELIPCRNTVRHDCSSPGGDVKLANLKQLDCEPELAYAAVDCWGVGVKWRSARSSKRPAGEIGGLPLGIREVRRREPLGPRVGRCALAVPRPWPGRRSRTAASPRSAWSASCRSTG